MTMLRREDVKKLINDLDFMGDHNKREICAALDALPATEPERAEGVEPRPEKPAMLLARRFTGMGGIWVWMTRREADWSCQWHGSDDCDYKSRDFLEVDRAASDEAALKLYDTDIAALRRKG